MRATFMPCSASGMAHPSMTSSMRDDSRPGARSTAVLIASAARSSGRVVRSTPRGAFPTGVRTAETITASFILIPECLSRLEEVTDSFLGSRHLAQLDDGGALKVEDVLFVNPLRLAQVAPAQNVSNSPSDFDVVIARVTGFVVRIDS